MDQALAKRIEAMLLEDHRLDRVHLRRYHEYSDREILRPGFTRLNLPYFMDDVCVDFVLSAVAMVAEHGWKLLPQVILVFGLWEKRYKLPCFVGFLIYLGVHSDVVIDLLSHEAYSQKVPNTLTVGMCLHCLYMFQVSHEQWKSNSISLY